MSRDQIIKIAMVVCAVIVLCAVIVTSTGMLNVTGIGTYANAEKYTAGDTEISGGVRKLDVNWTSGKVNIEYHAENTVTLRETAKGNLSEDMKLHWWMDGETLRVQFAKAGIRLSMPEKELTVTLPQGIELEEAAISLTSGELTIPDMKVKKMDLGATSGKIICTVEAEEAEVNTTSGEQILTWKGKTEKVKAGSTSGSIRMTAEDVKEAELGSTSGSVRLEAEKAEKIKAGSTSGSVEITAADNRDTDISCTSGKVQVSLGTLRELRVSTTSGRITAVLPKEPGFKAEVTTVSGGFDAGMALTKHGDTYTCGDESGKVHLSSVSGSIRIEER